MVERKIKLLPILLVALIAVNFVASAPWFAKAKSWVKDKWNKVKSSCEKAFAKVKDALDTSLAAIKNIPKNLKQALDDAKKDLKKGKDDLVTQIKTYADTKVKAKLEAAKTSLQETFTKIESLGSFMDKKVIDIINKFNNSYFADNKVQGAAEELLKTLSDHKDEKKSKTCTESFSPKIESFVSTQSNKLVDCSHKMFDPILNGYENIKKIVKQAPASIKGFYASLKKCKKEAGACIGGVVDTLVGALGTIMRNVIEFQALLEKGGLKGALPEGLMCMDTFRGGLDTAKKSLAAEISTCLK